MLPGNGIHSVRFLQLLRPAARSPPLRSGGGLGWGGGHGNRKKMGGGGIWEVACEQSVLGHNKQAYCLVQRGTPGPPARAQS